MKILGLLLFVSIFEVFAQTTKSRLDTSPKPKVYREDLGVSSQSSAYKRSQPAGSLHAAQTSKKLTGGLYE